MTVKAEVQKLSPGDRVTLFELDTTNIGGAYIFRFTNSGRIGAGAIAWNGQSYIGLNYTASGFSQDGKGAFATPRIKVANGNGLFGSASIGDITGAKLTRIRTFEKFTDGGSNPDTSQVMPIDVYYVEQKIMETDTEVEWSFSSLLDQTGRKLPGRLVLRDVCPFKYRVYKPATDTFDYRFATCPYTGTNYFNEKGIATTKANDACSHRIDSGCKKRFGNRGTLPFGGFPGVQRRRSA